jgi:hypothetical protein
MNRITILLVAGLSIFLIGTESMASDRSIRCGTHLIKGGGYKDSAGQYEVLKKCGEPKQKNGDTWIYEQGSMLRILIFNYEGKLDRIESRKI